MHGASATGITNLAPDARGRCADQPLEVDARDRLVDDPADVHALEQRFDVDLCEQRVHVDAREEILDRNAFDDPFDRHPVDELVDRNDVEDLQAEPERVASGIASRGFGAAPESSHHAPSKVRWFHASDGRPKIRPAPHPSWVTQGGAVTPAAE